MTVPQSATTDQTWSGSITSTTYWPSGTLQLRLIDGIVNNDQSSWVVDYVGLVVST